MKPITPLVVALALALAGCASYAELQGKPPISDFIVDRPADAYMGCIAPRMREIFGASANVLPDGDSLVLSVAEGKHAVLSVTAAPEAGGTRVTYRQTIEVNSGNYRKAAAVVEACR